MPFKLIKKTVKGENTVGRVANKVLPLPKVREAIGAAIKGTKQGLPVPEFEEANLEEKITEARDLIEKTDGSDNEGEINQMINRVYDILDDGKANQSRALPARTRKIITKAASAVPILAYLTYAIISGDFSLQGLIDLLGGQ